MLYVKVDEAGNAIEPLIQLRELKRRLPNVSLPKLPKTEDVIGFGYEAVDPDFIGPPDVEPGQGWRPGIPQKVDGKWVRTWEIYEMSAKEIADRLRDLRKDRDFLLSQSDWTQMPDSPLTPQQKQEWAQYRAALRNLPNLPTLNLKKVVWPVRPV